MSANDLLRAVRKVHDSLVEEALKEFVNPNTDIQFIGRRQHERILRKLYTAFAISSSPRLMRLINDFERQYGGS